MELYKLTIHELKEKLKRREISAKELTLEFIKRIERVEKDIHSFITLTKDDALKQAEDIDNKINSSVSSLALISRLFNFSFNSWIVSLYNSISLNFPYLKLNNLFSLLSTSS